MIIGIIYLCKKKKNSSEVIVSVQIDNNVQVDNSAWEEAKRQKAKSLNGLKKGFIKAENTQEAITAAERAVFIFIDNQRCSVDDITALYKAIELPEILSKKELALRKELIKHYKNRENNSSRAFSIYLAFKHAELQLSNSNEPWKNFSGLQKLQSNLKAEEYFEALLKLMAAFKEEFKNQAIAEKIAKDVDKTFELWNSRNLANKTYQQNCKAYEKASRASDKHFIILEIIEYLDRRHKFNQKYRDELISWCEKDMELYDRFLVEFHEHELLTIDEQMKFMENPGLKAKKLSEISIDKVKRLKDYSVPLLASFNVLWSLYKQENNQEKLQWLEQIASRIGYIEKKQEVETNENIEAPKPTTDLFAITRTIEVPKSGQKGKLAFLNSKGEACSTEDAFKDCMEQQNWKVMRGEVSFWQAMFCLSFWEEIFDGMDNPKQGADIPHDLFREEEFYSNRKALIDRKLDFINEQNLQSFINNQIQKYRKHWTRLIYNGDQDLITYFETDIVQSFLRRIDVATFAKFVYRIAQNPNKNRSGVSDFVIWNDHDLKMIEVKKIREQVRESQQAWIEWMLNNDIPTEVVRVKGV